MVALNGKLLYKNLKKRTCKVGEHFTQELYMQENLPLFLQDLHKKTQHQVLLNQETTYM
jgi:hypothetical protein